MADRHDTSPSVGQALRDMALRSGSAFPDFNTVFDSERIERRRGRMVLAFGAILVLVCAAAFLGWPAIFPANPLIESWDEPSAEARLGMAGASNQDPIVSFIEVLWNASSDSGGTAR